VLDAGGIPVLRIDRGGDVTYHGPGQLVGYVLVDIQKIGVKGHVRRLEQSILDLLATFGVNAGRKEGCVGVWAPGGKIASFGVRVSRGVSTHGFALNVGGDLSPFGRIHPCGIRGCAVTSISAELGREATVEEAAERFQLRGAGGVLRS
jgi:lipoyl(octanoyl) transferase